METVFVVSVHGDCIRDGGGTPHLSSFNKKTTGRSMSREPGGLLACGAGVAKRYARVNGK